MPVFSMICFTIAALIIVALVFLRRFRNRAHYVAKAHSND